MTDPQPIPYLNNPKKAPPPAPAHKNYAGDDPTIDNDTNLLHRAHTEIDRLKQVVENHMQTIFQHQKELGEKQKTIDEQQKTVSEQAKIIKDFVVVPPKAEAQDDKATAEVIESVKTEPEPQGISTTEEVPASPTLVPKVPADATLENNS